MTHETEMIDLSGIGRKKLCHILTELGLKAFRGEQVFQWIQKHGQFTFDQMTNLSIKDRALLSDKTRIGIPALVKHQKGSDGTEKFLFGLSDGHTIEGVMIPEEKRLTLCVSTQVGCAMECTFCLTGQNGFVRNLRTSEIVGQILLVQSLLPKETRLTHLVIMGMGEPLANYEQSIEAIRILLDPLGANFSKRKITLSTCGLIPGIQRLAKENLGIHLAVSLNASDSSTRDRLMPINHKYPMDSLLEVLKSYPLPARNRMTIEYVLIGGINDSIKDAKRLVSLLQGIRCKVNLIPFNEIPGLEYRPPPKEHVVAFQNVLLDSNLTAIVRESRGKEISAACGQLRGSIHKNGGMHISQSSSQ